MSSYMNKYDLFLEPKITEQGNHMVMTNVQKQGKVKYVNIDSKFKDEYFDNVNENKNADLLANQLSLSTFTMTLPEKITDVKSITVKSVEIPNSYYNISSHLGNNYMKVKKISNSVEELITLPDGQYDLQGIQNTVNNLLSVNAGFTDLTIQLSNDSVTTVTSSVDYNLIFGVNAKGEHDKFRFRSKLGYMLGFRNATYSVESTTISSESLPNLNSTKYIYLALEEFNKNKQNSFTTPLSNSLINNNILSRMTVNNGASTFGDLIVTNYSNGNLISDKRNYSGTVDLQKIKVSLLDENGNPLDLNGLDYSFCLEVEHV